MTSLYAVLDDVFSTHAQQDCLRLSGQPTWRYADLQSYVGRASQVLKNHGVGVGDRVVVQAAKSPQCLALYLATIRIGAVYVPLNTAYTSDELAYFLQDAQPQLFVGGEAHEAIASLTLQADGSGTFPTAVDAEQATAPIHPSDTDTLAAILYTSGTTGRSKGAMLSHGNLLSNARALSEAWGWRHDDVLLHALPIFHVHGLFIASHCALLNGSAIEWMEKFDPAAVMSRLRKCTVMMGVPTFYVRLLNIPDFPREPLDHMRVFICGSAPLTEQVFKAWETRTGHRILERYGMSETIINTSNPLHGERLAGTVGYPLPGMDLRIADDAGQPLAVGEVGTIEVRGANVFDGYWRMPDKTAEEIRPDGFFITGDLGTQAADGRVSIVGRAKDLVISGGYNVYPKEIERVIDELASVHESAVIGLPHADFGEAVVAVVVPADANVSLADLDLALQDKLARFKQPKAVINLPELPRNAMGKVQKNALRETYKDFFA